jgi:enoyl-CoA hydratase/carnithine racemase
VISSHLPLVEKACGLYVEEMLPAMLARRLTLSQAFGFCTLYRRMAAAKLLTSGVPDEFFADLSRSARAFVHYLSGITSDAKQTGRAEPFFDAVACNDDSAAGEIASLSRTTWNQGAEYEDDFLYVWFLMQRFVLRAPAPALQALLDRWKEIEADGDDTRLRLCEALHRGDQERFDEALSAMIEARERENRERIRGERMHPDDVPTLAKIWVELLALLRFAQVAGLSTESHYPMAPAVARRLDRVRPPRPDAWRSIRTYREIS